MLHETLALACCDGSSRGNLDKKNENSKENIKKLFFKKFTRIKILNNFSELFVRHLLRTFLKTEIKKKLKTCFKNFF